MKNIVVTGSITHAIRGRDLLRKNGYKATVERNSGGLGRHGCGYGIVVEDDPNEVRTFLENKGVKIIDIARIK